jgi:cysteine desulfurase / selenocysteine lyase
VTAAGQTDWQKIRAEFPALRGRTFLNTATYGQLPKKGTEAALAHFERRDRFACTDFLEWFAELDDLRGEVARLVGAQADDIAFITAACHGLATVLSGIDWKPGDEILTLEHEFPNNLYAAQSEAGVTGKECAWSELEQNVTSRTRLVLLSTVNYVTGLRPDLDGVIGRLRERNVLVYVDGTQSVGALRFDCAKTQPDFLSVDAYKWLISPNGAGFLYVRPEVRKWLRPNVIGWRSDRNWRGVDNLHHGAPRFQDSSEKYEGGMMVFSSLCAMRESISLMEEIGPAVIEDRVLQLAGDIRREMAALGAELHPHEEPFLPSQIVLAKLPGVDVSSFAKQLQSEGIVVSARKGHLRVSAHFYNDEQDIARLAEAVKRNIGQAERKGVAAG